MQDSSQPPESDEMIMGLVEARNLKEKIEYIRRHPYLLSDASLRFFDALRESSLREGDEYFAEIYWYHRTLLEHARQVGLTQAYDEMYSVVTTQIIVDFVSSPDPYAYLIEHPQLMSAGVIDILAGLEADARASGQRNLAKIIATRSRLIRRVQNI